MPSQNVSFEPIVHAAEAQYGDPPPSFARELEHTIAENDRELPASLSPSLNVACTSVAERDSACGLQLRLHENLADVADIWQCFEQVADRTVFQSSAWLTAWQHHIGHARGTLPAIVTGCDRDGQLLLILQLGIETTRTGRRLTWLGSELCDYNAPLLAHNFSDRMSAERFALLWRDVVDLLQAVPRFGFDLVDLQKMPESVGGQRNPFMDFAVEAHPSGAYVAHLDADWETFYAAKRSASTRKRERRQLKQLAEHGEVRFLDIEDPADIEQTLTALFEQKARAFARMGIDNLLADPGRRAFFLAIASDPAMRHLVHVGRLDVGGSMAAINVGLTFRDCYYLILSSYDDGELARLGPGRAHLNELIQRAISRGFTTFDFTVGDEPYKRDWSDLELKLFDHLAAVSPRGHAIMAVTGVFRRAKRFIKQSPPLWRAFSKVRALAGCFAGR
ncbi:MAG: GNAT family N-acetyltransferase [Xanthobacteraceae bacterium]